MLLTSTACCATAILTHEKLKASEQPLTLVGGARNRCLFCQLQQLTLDM